MPNPAQIDENIRTNDIKPIFCDGFMIGFRIKAKNMKPGEANIESAKPLGGLLELTFVDEGKQQALGRFVMDRATAEDLSNQLVEAIKKFDGVMGKDGLTKLLPKSSPKSGDSSYR